MPSLIESILQLHQTNQSVEMAGPVSLSLKYVYLCINYQHCLSYAPSDYTINQSCHQQRILTLVYFCYIMRSGSLFSLSQHNCCIVHINDHTTSPPPEVSLSISATSAQFDLPSTHPFLLILRFVLRSEQPITFPAGSTFNHGTAFALGGLSFIDT